MFGLPARPGRCPGTPPAGGTYAAGTPARRAARSSFRTPLATPAPGGASFRTPPPNPRLLAGAVRHAPAPLGVSRQAGDDCASPRPPAWLRWQKLSLIAPYDPATRTCRCAAGRTERLRGKRYSPHGDTGCTQIQRGLVNLTRVKCSA